MVGGGGWLVTVSLQAPQGASTEIGAVIVNSLAPSNKIQFCARSGLAQDIGEIEFVMR